MRGRQVKIIIMINDNNNDDNIDITIIMIIIMIIISIYNILCKYNNDNEETLLDYAESSGKDYNDDK